MEKVKDELAVEEEKTLPEKKSQLGVSVGAFMGLVLINVFQIIPVRTFKVLYPLLYGDAGFSEDDLSILRLGSIPSCLKFIAGFIFQSIWIAPRWVPAVMNVINAILIFLLVFIPLEQVGWNVVVFLVVQCLRTACDVIVDGQFLLVFRNSGVVYGLLQIFSNNIYDVIISFVGTAYFERSMFVYIGVILFLGTPCYWLIPWEKLPKISFGPVLKSIWDSRWMFIITLFYGMASEWSTTMLSYFVNDIVDETAKMGAVFSLYKVAVLIGMMFGQFIFIKVAYRIGILGAIVMEIIGVVCLLFLSPKSPLGLIAVLFLVVGLLSSFSDAVPRTMQIDAANLTQSPIFLYAWFISITNVTEVVSGILAPQSREALTWTGFWLVCLAINGGMIVILGLMFFLIPDARKDQSLTMRPTFDMNMFGCCRDACSNGRSDIDPETATIATAATAAATITPTSGDNNNNYDDDSSSSSSGGGSVSSGRGGGGKNVNTTASINSEAEAGIGKGLDLSLVPSVGESGKERERDTDMELEMDL